MSNARLLLQKFREGKTPKELITEGRYGSAKTVYKWHKRFKKFEKAMDALLGLFIEVEEMPTESREVMAEHIKVARQPS